MRGSLIRSSRLSGRRVGTGLTRLIEQSGVQTTASQIVFMSILTGIGIGFVADMFIRLYGPTVKAYAALDEAGKAALRADFAEVWTRNNTATDGTTAVDAEYLEIVGTRA